MTRSEQERNERIDSYLMLGCGALGLFGAVIVVLGDLIGILVVDAHNPISETISALAAGRHAWIQDLGIVLFAVGVVACAVGLHAWRPGGWAWRTGLVLLFLLGVVLVPIAEYNQYAGTADEGANIHLNLVYTLYGLFALATLLLSFGLARAGRAWRRFSLGTFVAWTVLAPFFFMVPTAWDGGYERLIAAIMVAWFGAVSWLLIQQGRDR